MNKLGKWAIIDIETTGIDPNYDEIIDLGVVYFEGSKLMGKYSSLIRPENSVSPFISKLTGITNDMLKNARPWQKIEAELQEFKDYDLIAHNSNFEKSFLQRSFDRIDGDQSRFHDSMLFLALLYPQKSSLNLESFLLELNIKENEAHRGLEDSLDLLKVMLLGVYQCKKNTDFYYFLKTELERRLNRETFWFVDFLNLDENELLEIAYSIDFDLLAFEKSAMAYNDLSKANETDQVVSLDFTGKNIQSILSDEKRLKAIFDNYSFRPAQLAMSLKVGQSFKNNIHSIIQAPTGTGKTLGYLLPSALLAISSKQKVLISTGTKALQAQAIEKDIPELYKILGKAKNDLSVVRLYGSKNHFCELKLRNLEQESLLKEMESFEQTFAHLLLETYLFYNALVSDYNEILTRQEVPYVLKKMMRSLEDLQDEVAVDFRSCTGHKCPFKDNCTYFNGLKKAKDADLIIGNHSLLLTWPKAMDRPSYIVIDEAHKMESEVTDAYTLILKESELDHFGTQLSSMVGPLYYLLNEFSQTSRGDNGPLSSSESDVSTITQRLQSDIKDFSEIIRDHTLPLAQNLERFFKRQKNYTDIYWNEAPVVKDTDLNSSLESSIYNHIESLSYVFNSLYETLLPYASKWSVSDMGDDPNYLNAWSSFENSFSQIENAYTIFKILKNEAQDLVASIKFHEEEGYLFCVAPIDVGKIIFENVIEGSESCVFTSATLSNHKGSKAMASVEWMTGHRYIEAEKRFKKALFLDNDFNYKDNVRVFLTDDSPQIFDKEYVSSVLLKIIPLIKEIGGRSLLLFSSRVRFDKAVEILLSKVESEHPLFIQGMGQSVIEDFKKSDGGVLIGMESFGEGIDVPGDKLQFVYIDKIPDLRRDLIIEKRREFYSREFGNEFVDYFLSHRTRSLHQKLGRLMRRKSDRGAIIISDPRIKKWKQRTLQTFADMMLPYEIRFENLEIAAQEALEFIKKS